MFSFYARLVNRNKLNVFKTLVINLVMFPFKEAIKFPILIYGTCKLYELSGKIVFLQPIKRGILRIGLTDPVRSFYSKSFISISGDLEVGNNVILRKGINLQISKNALVHLDDDVSIGNNTTIISFKKICIGKGTSIGNNCLLMDSDFHYIINIKTREVKPNKKEIHIGEFNWIGGWCTIKKGTCTPKGTIVAGPYSMVDKNHIGKIPDFCIIAGSPARLISEGVRRIKNSKSDNIIYNHYIKEVGNYILPIDESIDNFCNP